MSGPRYLRRQVHLLLSAVILTAVPATDTAACGRDTDCSLGDRSYRIALPEGRDGGAPIGAIVYVHGYRGTAAGVMNNKALTSLASELGIAFIAAQAKGIEWNLPGVPSDDAQPDVDELAYFDALIADASRRVALDPSRVVVAGFSSGAMMVWHLACQRGGAFLGYVPMSGTFWAPIPRACPGGPVNLIHYHGREDPVVPLQGRQIKDAHQGDVFEAVKLIERTGGYRAVAIEQPQALDCSRWENAGGKLIELCLFTGKHEMKVGHLVRAWQLFTGAVAR